MRGLICNFVSIISLLILLIIPPLVASAQDDYLNSLNPGWSDVSFLKNLEQNNQEREQEIAFLRTKINISLNAQVEAKAYLSGSKGAVSKDAQAVFRELISTASRSIKKNRRAIMYLERDIARVTKLQEILPVLGPQQHDAVLIDSWGDINIRKAGSEAFKYLKNLVPARLAPGDIIKIGDKGSVTFLYPEAAGEMTLGNNTRAVIETVGKSDDPRLMLLEGKVRFWLGRSSIFLNRAWESFKPTRFTLRTHNLIAGVRGTSFSVEVTADGGNEIFVFDGEVVITPEGSDKEIIISKGQSLIVRDDGSVGALKVFEETGIEAWWNEEPTI